MSALAHVLHGRGESVTGSDQEATPYVRALQEAGVNISRMQLALSPETNQAAMLVNIDSAPDPAVLEQLRSLPHMISAQLVELGP